MNNTNGYSAGDGGPVEAALADYFARIDCGEPVDVREIIARNPGCEAGLREFLRQERQLHQAVGTATMAGSATEKLDGRLLGDFQLGRVIGRGGMGVVYEAEQISLGRHVALKMLPFAAMLDQQQLARFKNEARAAATLHHEHIVPIHAVGSDRGVHFYAMQLIDGQSLAQVIKELKAKGEEREPTSDQAPSHFPGRASIDTAPVAHLSTRDARSSSLPARSSSEFWRTVGRLGIEAAEALDHAHQNGILHRDIKPANLLVDNAGKLWITDFGLARIEADAGMTMTGDLLGTLRYMSPEQALAKRAVVDHRSDIYSLGVTLYELLTLEPAFGETDRARLLKQIAFEEPHPPRQINRQIPKELETIILKAMRKYPGQRYATAQNLADDLQRFLENKPIKAKPVSVMERMFRWANRNRGLATMGVGALAVVSVVAIISSALILRANSRTATALETSQVNEEKARQSAAAAEANERKMRELLYAADMALAGAAWKKNEPAEVRMILDRYAEPKNRDNGTTEKDLRDFEWYFLDRQIHPESELLFQNEKALYLMEFMPGGKQFFTAGQDSIVRWHDALSGKVLRRLDTKQKEINCVSYNSAGTLFVTAGEDGTAKVYSATELSMQRSIAVYDDICAFAMFLDDVLIITGGNDSAHHLFNVQTGEAVRDFVSPDAKASGVKSPNSLDVHISATKDRFWSTVSGGRAYQGVYEWNLASGTSRRLSDDYRPARVLIDQSEKFLFINLIGGSTRIVDTKSGAELWSTRLDNTLEAMTISPNERRLAVGDRNGQVYVWNLDLRNPGAIVTSNLPEKLVIHGRGVYDIQFTPDAKSLVTASEDGTVRRTPLGTPPDTLREITWLSGKPDVAVIPGTNRIVAAQPLAVHDQLTGAMMKVLSNRPYEALAVSSDGRLVAAVSTNEIGVWNITTGEQMLHIDWKRRSIGSLDFSPDESLLAVVSDDGETSRLDVVETATGAFDRYTAPENRSKAAFFCANDGLIEMSHQPNQFTHWIIPERRIRWQRNSTVAHRVAGSPNRKLLLGAGRRTLHLVDSATGVIRHKAPCDYGVESVAFLGDGRCFVVGGIQGQLSVWNTATGQRMFELANLGTSVQSIEPLEIGFLASTWRVRDGRAELVWYEF